MQMISALVLLVLVTLLKAGSSLEAKCFKDVKDAEKQTGLSFINTLNNSTQFVGYKKNQYTIVQSQDIVGCHKRGSVEVYSLLNSTYDFESFKIAAEYDIPLIDKNGTKNYKVEYSFKNALPGEPDDGVFSSMEMRIQPKDADSVCKFELIQLKVTAHIFECEQDYFGAFCPEKSYSCKLVETLSKHQLKSRTSDNCVNCTA